MNKFAIVLIVCFLLFIGSLLYVALRPKEYIEVDLHELVENPTKFKGKWIHTRGYLGDTGEIDFSMILVPIIVSTGDSTVIIFVPLTDSDYYYMVYETNAFEKGVILKLENKCPDLLGQKVEVYGYFDSFTFKFNGKEYKTYKIEGHVEEMRDE